MPAGHYTRLTHRLERTGDWLMPTLARLVFAGVLLMYFWRSAMTKLDGGPFTLDAGGVYQIFPRAMEASGFDVSALATWQVLVALLGTWAEFILPTLIILGLFTRFAALGMIGFVLAQSVTDIVGHGSGDAETLGAWFDRVPDAAILDQRALWVLVFAILVVRGGGPLSLDRLFRRNGAAPYATPSDRRTSELQPR